MGPTTINLCVDAHWWDFICRPGWHTEIAYYGLAAIAAVSLAYVMRIYIDISWIVVPIVLLAAGYVGITYGLLRTQTVMHVMPLVILLTVFGFWFDSRKARKRVTELVEK